MTRATRIHVAVGVRDIDDSAAFYRALLGSEPTVVGNDQIDWILDAPAVNFSIFTNPDKPIGVEHIGLDFAPEELAAGQARVGSVEPAIVDPDGLRIELFSRR